MIGRAAARVLEHLARSPSCAALGGGASRCASTCRRCMLPWRQDDYTPSLHETYNMPQSRVHLRSDSAPLVYHPCAARATLGNNSHRPVGRRAAAARQLPARRSSIARAPLACSVAGATLWRKGGAREPLARRWRAGLVPLARCPHEARTPRGTHTPRTSRTGRSIQVWVCLGGNSL